MFRRLIVPLDGSTIAERALPYAAQISRAYSAPVLLLRAYAGSVESARALASMQSIPNTIVDPGTVQLVTDSAQTAEAEARAYLREQAAALTAEGLTVEAAVIDAEPGDAIVSEAEREPDTLVVLCSHGGGMERLLLGSTAKHVLHNCHEPVMLIRLAESIVPSDTSNQPDEKE